VQPSKTIDTADRDYTLSIQQAKRIAFGKLSLLNHRIAEVLLD
jgi:hypothetical protein